MVGGVDCEEYKFKVTPDDVRRSTHGSFLSQPTPGPLVLIGYCIAFVTKHDGILNAANRPEYLVFFKYTEESLVIVRAKCPIDITQIRFIKSKDESGNILSLKSDYSPFIVGVSLVNIQPDNFNKEEDVPKDFSLVTVTKLMKKLDCSEVIQRSMTLHMFQSYKITTKDNESYRIIVCSTGNSLFTPTFTFTSRTTLETYDDISKLLSSMATKDASNHTRDATLIHNVYANLKEVKYPAVPEPDIKSNMKDIAKTLLTISYPSLGQPVKKQYGFETPSDYLTPAQQAEKDRQAREDIHDSIYTL